MSRLPTIAFLCVVAPCFSQGAGTPQQLSSQNSPETRKRTALAVKPGENSIKNKDLFDQTGVWHPLGRLPRFVLEDQEKIWTSPFHMSKKDAKYWLIFGGATAVLAAFDEQIQQKAPNPRWLVTLGTRGSYLGASYTLIPLSASFYFIGTKTGNSRFREAGLMSFEALMDSTIVEEALKVATDRERPLEGTGEGRFFNSPNRINAGFPSGHATNTFALASVFEHEYHDKWWVKLLAYSWAGGVAGSRLAADRHFPSDTLAGGAIGWFIGDYIYAKRHNAAIGKPPLAERILDHVQINFGD
jgi:membrane-associated phospholipid phosphatase